MKAYFIIRNFMEESLASVSAGLALKSYKIDNAETLPGAFFVENQVISGNPIASYFFCKVDADGSNPNATTDPALVNSYNPFNKHFGLVYPLVNDVMRGLPTGTFTGTDYGDGIMNIGVDKPAVITGNGSLVNGAFFIDVDFTKSLKVEFDVVSNIVNGQVYENPQILRQYTIEWNKEQCLRSFRYLDYQTGDEYQDDGFGFLFGHTEEVENPFIDFGDIECGSYGNGCENKERTISYALGVEIPEPTPSPDEVFKECCYQHIVLASTTDSDDLKNDYSSFFYQKQIPSQDCEFKLYRFEDSTTYDLNDDTYGEFFDFGHFSTNVNLTGYKIEWRKVLQELGEGSYKIIKMITISGMNFEEDSFTFTLKNYSDKYADDTVRIDVVMDGNLIKSGLDFKGCQWKHSIRIGGFFGWREPKYEEDIIVRRDYNKTQVSMKQANEYKFQSNLLPYCITNEIFDFILYANEMYITDYNLNNHSYLFRKIFVRLSNNDGTNYKPTTRKARLNLTFTDGKSDNLKRNFS